MISADGRTLLLLFSIGISLLGLRSVPGSLHKLFTAHKLSIAYSLGLGVKLTTVRICSSYST